MDCKDCNKKEQCEKDKQIKELKQECDYWQNKAHERGTFVG